jgi:hypothetical protein
MNSEFSLLAARHLAARIRGQGTEDREQGQQIEQLYLLVLSRRPTEAESAKMTEFLIEQRDRLATEARPRGELALPIGCPDSADPHAAAALVDACLAMLNSSEFVYVD